MRNTCALPTRGNAEALIMRLRRSDTLRSLRSDMATDMLVIPRGYHRPTPAFAVSGTQRSNLPKCGRECRHRNTQSLGLCCKVIRPEGLREYVTVWGGVTGVYTWIGRGGGNFLLLLNHGDNTRLDTGTIPLFWMWTRFKPTGTATGR